MRSWRKEFTARNPPAIAGVIQGYVAVLDQQALGRPENSFVEITLTHQSEELLDAFEAVVATCPGVMSCHFMTGDSDYLLHVVAANTAHYEQLYRTYLSRFPGVARIRSSFAVRGPNSRLRATSSQTPFASFALDDGDQPQPLRFRLE